jgi:hypothetical protein
MFGPINAPPIELRFLESDLILQDTVYGLSSAGVKRRSPPEVGRDSVEPFWTKYDKLVREVVSQA